MTTHFACNAGYACASADTILPVSASTRVHADLPAIQSRPKSQPVERWRRCMWIAVQVRNAEAGLAHRLKHRHRRSLSDHGHSPRIMTQRFDQSHCSPCRALLLQECERQTGSSLLLLSRRGLFPRPQRGPRGRYAACRCLFHIIHAHMCTLMCTLLCLTASTACCVAAVQQLVGGGGRAQLYAHERAERRGTGRVHRRDSMHAYGRASREALAGSKSRAACMYPHTASYSTGCPTGPSMWSLMCTGML